MSFRPAIGVRFGNSYITRRDLKHSSGRLGLNWPMARSTFRRVLSLVRVQVKSCTKATCMPLVEPRPHQGIIGPQQGIMGPQQPHIKGPYELRGPWAYGLIGPMSPRAHEPMDAWTHGLMGPWALGPGPWAHGPCARRPWALRPWALPHGPCIWPMGPLNGGILALLFPRVLPEGYPCFCRVVEAGQG